MAQKNPTTIVNEAQLAAQAASLPPDLRRYIAQGAVRSQKVNQRWPYYSRVRMQAEVVEVDPGPPATFSYTFPAQQRVQAFSYGLGEPMIAAGFPAGRVGTIADTNIVEGRKTKDGERLYIYGISLHVVPLVSDPVLLAHWFGQASVTFNQASGDVIEKLGIPGFMPQTGGLFGAGESNIVEPYKMDNRAPVGFVNNGLPHVTNFFPLPEEIIWNPSGEVDSSLVVEFINQQTFSIAATEREGNDPTTFEQDYDPPSEEGDIGTFIELMVLFHSRSEERRGVNQ